MDQGPDDIRRQLREHGQARVDAARQRAEGTEAIKALAPKALAAGLTKFEVAELAQISRVTLDRLLD